MCTGSNKNWTEVTKDCQTKHKFFLNHSNRILPYPNENQHASRTHRMIQTGLLWQLLNRWCAIFRKKIRGHHTTLEPCLVQARVRGGLPVHEHVKAASIPISTVPGFGSVSNLDQLKIKDVDSHCVLVHFIRVCLVWTKQKWSPLQCSHLRPY